MTHHLTMEQRFWHYVTPEPNTGCWLWDGPPASNGYGFIYGDGERVRVHRWAFRRFVGPIPRGAVVMHRCDVRCCVNPHHLSLGSLTDNNRDRDEKGRQAAGSKNGQAVLGESDVRAIRASNKSQKELAELYGVHKTTISLVVRRETWRWVA